MESEREREAYGRCKLVYVVLILMGPRKLSVLIQPMQINCNLLPNSCVCSEHSSFVRVNGAFPATSDSYRALAVSVNASHFPNGMGPNPSRYPIHRPAAQFPSLGYSEFIRFRPFRPALNCVSVCSTRVSPKDPSPRCCRYPSSGQYWYNLSDPMVSASSPNRKTYRSASISPSSVDRA